MGSTLGVGLDVLLAWLGTGPFCAAVFSVCGYGAGLPVELVIPGIFSRGEGYILWAYESARAMAYMSIWVWIQKKLA